MGTHSGVTPLMIENLRMESSKYTILVVDDEEPFRNLMVTFLSKLGYSCVTAIDGVDALDKMKGNKFDAVATDMRMPNMDGITLTTQISMQYPDLPIMIMTAFAKDDSPGIAIIVGARDFIKKPFSLNEFSVRLHKMINDSEAQRRMKRGKGVDNIRGFTNELEPPKQMKREKHVDKVIQESINEVEPPKRMKSEKSVDDRWRELLDEVEASLKKIQNSPKNT